MAISRHKQYLEEPAAGRLFLFLGWITEKKAGMAKRSVTARQGLQRELLKNRNDLQTTENDAEKTAGRPIPLRGAVIVVLFYENCYHDAEAGGRF